MSKLKTKIFQQIQKLSTVFSIIFLAMASFVVSQNVDADWVPPNPGPPPSPGYYMDTPTSPHEIMTYEVGYVNNDFTTSPMFVEIRLAKVDGTVEDTTVDANDFLEIVEIIETLEVDDNKNALPGALVRNIDPADASFAGGPNENQVKLILTPRHDETNPNGGCVPDPAGGCKWDLGGVNTTWDPKLTSCNATELPYNVQMSTHTICEADPNDPNFTQLPNDGVKGKYEIKIALKPHAPEGVIAFTTRRASLNSPRANDVFGNPWYMNIDYTYTNTILDPTHIPTVSVNGQSGSGSPVPGQPYTVNVTDIKAMNGQPLASGSCDITGVGSGSISNGTCVIVSSSNATDPVPAGTVLIKDNGESVCAECRSIEMKVDYPATPATGTTTSPLTQSQIPGLDVTCDVALPGGTTTCSFSLPTDTTLPVNFGLGIDTENPQSCTAVGSAVTCVGVPVPGTAGDYPIVGYIDRTTATPGLPADGGTGTDTGETAVVASELTQSDLAGGDFASRTNLTCSPNPVNNDGSVDCAGKLPDNKFPPQNSSVMKLNLSGRAQRDCTFANQNPGATYSCNDLPASTSVSANYGLFTVPVYADETVDVEVAIDAGDQQDTGLDVRILDNLPRTGGTLIIVGSVIGLAVIVVSALYYNSRRKKMKVTKS